jgi:hypothetical protein
MTGSQQKVSFEVQPRVTAVAAVGITYRHSSQFLFDIHGLDRNDLIL